MNDRQLIRLTAGEILSGLNRALAAERRAVADYHAHARAIDRPETRKALEALGDVEQEHALLLAARIRALGGSPAAWAPDVKGTSRPPAGDLAEWLANDLEAEQWAIVEYARLVAGIVDDDETAALMAELLDDEIRHAAWLKTELRALGK